TGAGPSRVSPSRATGAAMQGPSDRTSTQKAQEHMPGRWARAGEMMSEGKVPCRSPTNAATHLLLPSVYTEAAKEGFKNDRFLHATRPQRVYLEHLLSPRPRPTRRTCARRGIDASGSFAPTEKRSMTRPSMLARSRRGLIASRSGSFLAPSPLAGEGWGGGGEASRPPPPPPPRRGGGGHGDRPTRVSVPRPPAGLLRLGLVVRRRSAGAEQ